ncbi:MAG: hypothetical protein APF78_00010 [Sphingomonadales bacterium BRH_c3]|nr:MAG: hypothetical protein APF78_00010 [Sphingomonadales bacterium BRH_c3]
MHMDDRRMRLGESPNRAIFLAWLGLCAVLLLVAGQNILAVRFPGPDDSLRLAQVRDLLAGQGWYDLHQYRMTPPEGTLMHWSRLVDVPIAALILLFSQFMEMPQAERATMIVLPLLILLPTTFAVGRLTWRLFDRQTAIYACLALLLLPLVPMQFQPLRIDHHGWQIFTVAFGAWAMSWRSAPRGGAAAGLAMAFGLMISLEVIFLAAAFGLIFALRWMRDHRARWWLVAYLQTLALGLAVAFALTRGLPDLAAHCDVISPPHLGFFLIVALGSGMLAVAPRMPRLPLVLALGSFALLGLGFLGWSAPQCLAPPFAGLDPLVRDYWYLNVSEGRPLWNRSVSDIIPALVQPLFALGVTLYLAGRSHDWLRGWLFEYALLLAIAFCGGVMTYRSMAFAGVLAALPMGWFIGQMFKRWRAYPSLLPKLGLALLLFAVFLPGGLVTMAMKLAPDRPSQGAVRLGDSRCELHSQAQLLKKLPPAILFTPLDIGPAVLAQTRHSVVASAHHRAEQAMHDVIFSFTSPPALARQYVDAYKADYVVLCADVVETRNFSIGGGEGALMSRLLADDPPDWLAPVDIGGPDELKVWRVIRSQGPGPGALSTHAGSPCLGTQAHCTKG